MKGAGSRDAILSVRLGRCGQGMIEKEWTVPLTLHAVFSVLDRFGSLQEKWRKLGRALKIDNSDLDAIAAGYDDAEDDAKEAVFRSVLNTWLSRRHLRPSWTSLLTAIEAMDDEGPLLAKRVRVVLNEAVLNENNIIKHLGGELGEEWWTVGILLGVKNATLETISMECHRRTSECIVKMLSKWLRSDLDASWDKLVAAIASPAGGNNILLAKEITRKVPGVTLPSFASHRQESRDQQIDFKILSKLCKRFWKQIIFVLFVFLSWLLLPTDQCNRLFEHRFERQDLGNMEHFQISLIYHYLCSQQKASAVEIFLLDIPETNFIDPVLYELTDRDEPVTSPEESGKRQLGFMSTFDIETGVGMRVLVEGRGGSGKSTIARRISKLWAEGKLLNGCYVVLLIELNLLQGKKDLSWIDIFTLGQAEGMPHIKMDLIDEIIKRNICYVLDGLSEYVPGFTDESNLIYQLVRGKLRRDDTVIVLSRPDVLSKPFQIVNKRIELFGFNETGVNMFLKNYYFNKPDYADQLSSYFERHHQVLKLCQNPLQLIFFLHIWEGNRKSDFQPPSTVTELYVSLVTEMLKREVQISNETLYRKYECLFLDIVDYEHIGRCSHELAGQYQAIVQLAYEGIYTAQDKIKTVFGREEATHLNLSKSNSLGLVFSYYSDDHKYTFLHDTIQDFLAAYHLTLASDVEMVSSRIAKYHRRNAWVFYCGLYKTTYFDGSLLTVVLHFYVSHASSDPSVSVDGAYRCAAESKDAYLAKEALYNTTGAMTLFVQCGLQSCSNSWVEMLSFMMFSVARYVEKMTFWFMDMSACNSLLNVTRNELPTYPNLIAIRLVDDVIDSVSSSGYKVCLPVAQAVVSQSVALAFLVFDEVPVRKIDTVMKTVYDSPALQTLQYVIYKRRYSRYEKKSLSKISQVFAEIVLRVPSLEHVLLEYHSLSMSDIEEFMSIIANIDFDIPSPSVDVIFSPCPRNWLAMLTADDQLILHTMNEKISIQQPAVKVHLKPVDCEADLTHFTRSWDDETITVDLYLV